MYNYIPTKNFLVTTPEILSQDYLKAIRKFHWIERVINFGFSSSDSSASTSYLCERIQPTLRSKIEHEARPVNMWSESHRKSQVMNILSKKEVSDFKNKICDFFGLKGERFQDVVGAAESERTMFEKNKLFDKMIDISDE